MKSFKLEQGISRIFPIDKSVKDLYEKETKKDEKYIRIGKDGEKRCFAVCPLCDNPIQLIGLYKKIKYDPYGKHYNRSVPDIAKHNQQAYRYCPEASNKYAAPDKDERKNEMTEHEVDIYRTVKEHFDQIIYIIKQETELYISNEFARKLLRSYYAGEGWMYQWADLYNIPWVLIYLNNGFDLYGKKVLKEGKLAEVLKADPRYKLEDEGDLYYKVMTRQFVKSNFMLWKHRRTVKDHRLKETMMIEFSMMKNDNSWETLWEKEISINEFRFMNLITSPNAEKFRNQKLLDIANEIMPEL